MQKIVMTLEKTLNSYAFCIENFYPGDGEAGYINSARRYLGDHIDELSAQDQAKLDRIDANALTTARAAYGTWEEDEMRDLADFILATRAQQNAA
ncbi:MAG: hypothetical protein HQL47_05840 [Gammaproteobacteria bacterium]|nr:hypothetical protein [Gammaproteobacteria bacterium]